VPRFHNGENLGTAYLSILATLSPETSRAQRAELILPLNPVCPQGITEEPETEAPSTSPNSRHRRSANRLLVFQTRKRREEARGLSLTRILCRPAMQRLRESCFGASCPNSTPPAAVDRELHVATCAQEPRQLSASLADAVHTPVLKRRLSFCLSSTCGQDMQGGKAKARLRLDSTSRLCRASSTGIALSGRCPSGDNPPSEPSAPGIKRKINLLPSERKEARVAGQHLGR